MLIERPSTALRNPAGPPRCATFGHPVSPTDATQKLSRAPMGSFASGPSS
jgi:hypothetical protein